jgi:perosamine synthetase
MVANTKKQLNVEEFIERIKSVVGSAEKEIPLHAPDFGGNEKALLCDCIDTGWVSSGGKYVEQFEQEIANLCDRKFGVAVSSGTAALELAMRVVGVKSNEEVIMPSFTFVATANAAHHLGACPHFIDINENTLGMDPKMLQQHLRLISEHRNDGIYNLKTGCRIACIVPMHTFGHPVDFQNIKSVADEFGLPIIEDAAESLGSKYRNNPCGGLGDIAALSFNGNKIITTGGGGAIVTNNAAFAERAKHLSTTAKVPHLWEYNHDEIGYNYRLPNLNAALGVSQLQQLSKKIKNKKLLNKRYYNAFINFDEARIFRDTSDADSNFWLNTLILMDESNFECRNQLLKKLHSEKILARPAWTPLHQLPFHKSSPRSKLSVTEQLSRRIINLPSSASLYKN